MDIDKFLKNKYEEHQLNEVVKTEDLYSNISNVYLKKLFAIMHQQFNFLYKFMYDKKKTNGHFNAHESRELKACIELYEDMQYVLKETEFSFKMVDDYANMAKFCFKFLRESSGSAIPEDLPEIILLKYAPIFTMIQSITVPLRVNNSIFPIKFIGEGSYAQVFRYRDDFYNKDFIIKRAKKDLNEKELIRFKQEFEVMKKLKSPYVLEVYRYDENKNEYYMEYAHETLMKYIKNNSSRLSLTKRRGIAYQIFKGFEYIHSKGYLHRDISFTNILLQHYDNDLTVVKISDFGLVKIEQSDLTSLESEIKGSLNDSNLHVIGFGNYNIKHETFALTRLIYYVMTGKYNLDKINNQKVKKFVLRGINPDISQRYNGVEEMREAFKIAFLLQDND